MSRTSKHPDIPQFLRIAELFSKGTVLDIPNWRLEYSWDVRSIVKERID